MLKSRFVIFGVAITMAHCAVQDPRGLSPSGPSELGLSIAVTASPDAIVQDGHSKAIIGILAHDVQGRPVRGLQLRLETLVDAVPVDFGTLATKLVSTGPDGRAVVSYRAPAEPPAGTAADTIVSILVTPVSSDYREALPRSILVRLLRPGVIESPNVAPIPAFFFSPATPREEDHVQFDGSASADPDGRIASYRWSFGDGETGSGVRVAHAYTLAGTYQVTLSVTDDRGLTASTTPTPVPVSVAPVPIPDFSFSPTSPTAGQTVSFNASLTATAANRDIVSYEWDFGDGSPHAFGVTAHHSYRVPATYAIVLTVTDDAGRVGAISKLVTIEVPKNPGFLPPSVPYQ